MRTPLSVGIIKMIITRTPYRVSLFGGSTDYEDYYKKKESLLIGFCIDKYCYISLRRTPSILDFKTKAVYSKTEIVNDNKKIKHNGIRGCLQYLKIKYGVEINHSADLPAQTGVGSSSSFIVGLLHALKKMNGISPTKEDLSKEAIEIERSLLNEPGGIQDQIWAAYGGVNSINIYKDGSFEVKPLPISDVFLKKFLSRCVMVYCGKQRESFSICKSYSDKNSEKHKDKIKELSINAYKEFENKNTDNIGLLLHESWQAKKSISSLISTEEVDKLYGDLKSDGLIGGKLLGSGGMGFVFGILSNDVKKEDIKMKHKKNYIDFDVDSKGSSVLIY